MEVYVQTLYYQPGNVMTRLWEAALNCFCQETVPGLVKELAFATLKKAKLAVLPPTSSLYVKLS